VGPEAGAVGKKVNMSETENCHDCNAAPGEVHIGGCDVERCSVCKGQWIACGCRDHDPEQSKWTGLWPGVAECRERGWYVEMSGPPHYKIGPRCNADHPLATEDLNRWAVFVRFGGDVG
jgi:hypothetical protein